MIEIVFQLIFYCCLCHNVHSTHSYILEIYTRALSTLPFPVLKRHIQIRRGTYVQHNWQKQRENQNLSSDEKQRFHQVFPLLFDSLIFAARNNTITFTYDFAFFVYMCLLIGCYCCCCCCCFCSCCSCAILFRSVIAEKLICSLCHKFL